MAGILGSIGGAFGIGCGENKDLTYDGAERWGALVPMEKKAEVYSTLYTGWHHVAIVMQTSYAACSWHGG